MTTNVNFMTEFFKPFAEAIGAEAGAFTQEPATGFWTIHFTLPNRTPTFCIAFTDEEMNLGAPPQQLARERWKFAVADLWSYVRNSSEIIGSRNGEVIRVMAESVPDLRCREAIDCGKQGCTCDGCTMTRKAMAEQPILMSKVSINAPCPKCGKIMNGSRFCIGYGGSCDYVATDIESGLIRRLAASERQRDELLAMVKSLRRSAS